MGKDTELSLDVRGHDSPWLFNVELKRELPPVAAIRIAQTTQARDRRNAVLVVAPVIGPRAREILGTAKLSGLEVGGDCEIASGPLLIRMRSGRPRRHPADTKDRRVSQLFQGKALDIVRILLTPRLRAWKLEDMAHAARVSTPFVGRVFRTLELEAFVERQRGAGPRYALTAEAAADQIAPYARFSQVELYVESAEEWRKSLREVPREGNVLLIESEDRGIFDGMQRTRGLDLVSPPQLYVDLFRRGGAAREAAVFFRKQVQPWTETPERTREA